MEISFEYLNKLADQTILISSLLGGFSIAVIANIVVSDLNTRLSNSILGVSTFAACFFLVSLFAWTSLLLQTTPGYPMEVAQSDFTTNRLIGGITFFMGIASLIAMISLAGWVKSKKMGWLTTTIGVVTLILLIVTMQ